MRKANKERAVAYSKFWDLHTACHRIYTIPVDGETILPRGETIYLSLFGVAEEDWSNWSNLRVTLTISPPPYILRGDEQSSTWLALDTGEQYGTLNLTYIGVRAKINILSVSDVQARFTIDYLDPISRQSGK